MILKSSTNHKKSLVVTFIALVLTGFAPSTFALQADEDCYSAINRGKQSLTNNDIPGALSSFRAAQRFQPTDARPYFWIGFCLERSGDLNGAVKAYADCIDAAKLHGMDSAELRIDLGNTLCRLNYFKEAIYDYRRALTIDPSLTVAHMCLARACIETKDWTGAMRELDFCAAHAISVPEAGYLRALALTGLGSRPDALKQIQSFLNSEQRTLQNPPLLQRALALESELKRP
jgi:tetratricopeptide (TPR) repeat protein